MLLPSYILFSQPQEVGEHQTEWLPRIENINPSLTLTQWYSQHGSWKAWFRITINWKSQTTALCPVRLSRHTYTIIWDRTINIKYDREAEIEREQLASLYLFNLWLKWDFCQWPPGLQPLLYPTQNLINLLLLLSSRETTEVLSDMLWLTVSIETTFHIHALNFDITLCLFQFSHPANIKGYIFLNAIFNSLYLIFVFLSS